MRRPHDGAEPGRQTGGARSQHDHTADPAADPVPDGDPLREATLRCSTVIPADRAVLLVHRTGTGRDDWVLPGGTPRQGETLAACARREVLEETGLRCVPNRIAFVMESVDPDTLGITVDVVFLAGREVVGRPRECEPGLAPEYVPLADLAALHIRPPIGGHLRSLLTSPTERSAAYLGNLWRPPRNVANSNIDKEKTR